MFPVKPISVSVRQLCATAGAHEKLSQEESAYEGAVPLICPGVQKLQTFRIIERGAAATACENCPYSARGSFGGWSNHSCPAPQKSTLIASKPQLANWSTSCW